MSCAACHFSGGPLDAGFYLVTGTRDDLVNNNFALAKQTEDCQTANPGGGTALAACVQAINKAQFLIEPGAPAASDLLQRARPDEEGGTSTLGLAWYGSRGNRYNTTYGDRRMPSTTESTTSTDWQNLPIYFDTHPATTRSCTTGSRRARRPDSPSTKVPRRLRRRHIRRDGAIALVFFMVYLSL